MFNLGLISQRDNQPEDFAANAEGDLTARQITRLRLVRLPVNRHEYELESQIADEQRQLGPVTLVLCFYVALTVLLLLLGGIAATVPGLLLTLMGGAKALSIIIPSRQKQQELHRLRTHRDQAEAGLAQSLKAPDLRDFIQHTEGTIVLEQDSSAGRHQIHIGDQSFAVDGSLWQQVREQGGRMVAYYLATRDHGNLPLSIQSADDVEQAKLKHAVGISDDGELIYETDLTDDVPDGEVRPLNKRLEG